MVCHRHLTEKGKILSCERPGAEGISTFKGRKNRFLLYLTKPNSNIQHNVSIKKIPKSLKATDLFRKTYFPGFSFEAGGRTFRPVVCHSTSGTLRSILAIFFLLLYYIFFLLRHLMNILTMVLVQSWETVCCHGACWAGCHLPRQFTVLCWPLSVCILFLPKFPPCVSFAKRLLPVGLGDSFTWNGYSWKFIIEASTHRYQELC